MTNTQAGLAVISVRCEQKTFPPYDAFHGTPSPMLWRKVSFETAQGAAAFEQSDYGHPGRLNPWEPRGVAPALVAKLPLLRAAAEALAALL
jgi:hypothetical protein